MGQNWADLKSEYYGGIRFIESKIILTFDGEHYTMLFAGHRQYGILEMLSEIDRVVDPCKRIVEAIKNCGFYEEAINMDNIRKALQNMESYLVPLNGAVYTRYSIANVLYGVKKTLRWMIDNHKDTDYREELDISQYVIEKVFKGVDYCDKKIDCLGQLLLIGLGVAGHIFVHSSSNSNMFLKLFDKDTDDESGNKWKLDFMFSTVNNNPGNGFDIRSVDGKPSIVFEFGDLSMLAKFEVANAFNNNIKTCKCKNCGHYFPLHGRSDSLYCNYEAPNHPGRTCKEVGAQVTRAKKEKFDELTKRYRKEYMRLKMQERRHPEDESFADSLALLMAAYHLIRDNKKPENNEDREYYDYLLYGMETPIRFEIEKSARKKPDEETT